MTLEYQPYSLAPILFHKVGGRFDVNSISTIDLMHLSPYFHGVIKRMGAPFCLGSGLPYIPVTNNVSSLVASSRVSASK